MDFPPVTSLLMKVYIYLQTNLTNPLDVDHYNLTQFLILIHNCKVKRLVQEVVLTSKFLPEILIDNFDYIVFIVFS